MSATSSSGKRRDRGFTMIEVMIALLLTGIAVIGILALYISQTRASSFSRHTTEASALATDKLEKLRTMTPAASGSDIVDVQGQTGGIFTRTWTVSPIGAYSDLTVTITWEEDGGPRKLTVHGRRTN